MTRIRLVPLAAALVLAAACNSDVVTRPNGDDPAVAAKSGTGNPKFEAIHRLRLLVEPDLVRLQDQRPR